MRMGMVRRGVGALLAVMLLLGAVPAGAAEKSAPRHASQAIGKAERAMQEITAQAARETATAEMQDTRISSVMLHWEPYPAAVRYAVRVLRGSVGAPMKTIATMDRVYTTGLHLPLMTYGAMDDLYWTVQPLGYDGTPLAAASEPRPVRGETVDPTAPVLTTEYAVMSYAPLYPVYSWIPLAGQKVHEVEVYRREADGDRYVHTLRGGEYDVYDDMPFTVPGTYVYRVRGITESGTPISNWSAYGSFTVEERTPIAALGDSITHGGGAITVPPSYILYDWETYCTVPVKNLGHSGDTTEAMLARFERDVLPFSPRVLLIMGGVNDYRVGIYGAETVRNLAALREKCRAHGITPIFLTATPIRPALMTARMTITTPPSDWWAHRDYVNNWVMQQEHSIDVSTVLSDAGGELEEKYTTDGLHPDLMGKKYIGQTVDSYLRTHFAYASAEAERRVRMLKNMEKTS
ncbi:GDSL-type esterase/lipase family protein [uncultured Selenomonas sp.]|uniref:SGNH/GDSL hydrolase family protein n=1 Tax=uncultured Selenomonas sp. TaxID=159275 RepID=UPI0028E340B4|nr:GDSL-type esterase/lipase family protein [uncultured Selenomonas sp.]